MTHENRQTRAKWEKPALVTLDMDVNDVETQYDLGVDSLLFGLSTSQS